MPDMAIILKAFEIVVKCCLSPVKQVESTESMNGATLLPSCRVGALPHRNLTSAAGAPRRRSSADLGEVPVGVPDRPSDPHFCLLVFFRSLSLGA